MNFKQYADELYNEYKPSEQEKKKNAEIATPPKLKQEMLDKIPVEFWKNKNNTVFEPCCGKGGFVLDVIDRFMHGLQDVFENENERYKWIVEKCLYFSDINNRNINIVNDVLQSFVDEVNLNYNVGDTLKLDIKDKWGLDGFDLVVGNPPYNDEFNERSKTASPLYHKFIEYFLPHCQMLLFVIPSRWFSGGKGLDKFRKMMLNRTDIVYIQHYNNAQDFFGTNVEIKGGINHFLIDTQYNGLCSFNGEMITLNGYDILVENKYISLLEKVKKFDTIQPLYRGSNYYDIKTNDKRLCNDTSLVKCYVSQLKGFIKYIDNKHIKKNSSWKVITAEAAYKGKSGFGNMFIGAPEEVCTQSYIFFEVDNQEETKSLLSYLKCKLPNRLLGLRKISQHINKKTCEWIPLVPLDREWTNDMVYNYFNLTPEEIKLIEDTLK